MHASRLVTETCVFMYKCKLQPAKAAATVSQPPDTMLEFTDGQIACQLPLLHVRCVLLSIKYKTSCKMKCTGTHRLCACSSSEN
jgi:hypothetical protein